MEPQEKNNGVFIVIIFLLIAAFFLFYKMTRMESENATISKQIGYGRPNTEIEKIEREIEERQNKLRELQIKKELIQKKIRREEMSVQTKNQERVKTVKTNNTLVTRIISFDIETRKAVFNEMITSYQKAFVPQGTELPNDIFEKLSKTLPEGASSISIKKFITMYYKNKPQEEKYTILKTLKAMSELEDEIREWDISKLMIAYCILKSNNIELTKENLIKSQNCINGKMDYSEIEQGFYETFNIPVKNTREILNSLCNGRDWIDTQTKFAKDFLSTDVL